MAFGWNWAVARAINHLAGHVPIADTLMAFIATDLVFILVLAAAVWWFLPRRRDVAKHAALAAAFAVICGQALNLLIGHLVYVPRPFIAHHVLLLVNAAHDSSFPSDHATAAFSIAATALLRTMPGRYLFLLGAVLIAFARVYVGAHYPVDVVTGAALGSAWAVIILALDGYLVTPYRLAVTVARRWHLA